LNTQQGKKSLVEDALEIEYLKIKHNKHLSEDEKIIEIKEIKKQYNYDEKLLVEDAYQIEYSKIKYNKNLSIDQKIIKYKEIKKKYNYDNLW